MGGLIGGVAGAGLGLINHNQQKAEFNRQKELAAQQEALSPWTGVHGQMPKAVPNMMQSLVQGGLSGATMGMGGMFGGGAGGAQAPAMMGGPPMAGQAGGQDYGDSPWMSKLGQKSPTFFG